MKEDLRNVPVRKRLRSWLARADSRDLRPFSGMTRRWFVRVEWKVQDAWVGVFWKREYPWNLDVWVCIVPCVPLHFGWKAQARV